MTNFLNIHADHFTKMFFNDCDSDENYVTAMRQCDCNDRKCDINETWYSI